jgi:hypothetical protein
MIDVSNELISCVKYLTTKKYKLNASKFGLFSSNVAATLTIAHFNTRYLVLFASPRVLLVVTATTVST